MNKVNLLLLVVALNVALVTVGTHAGFGELFKKKPDKVDNAEPATDGENGVAVKAGKSASASPTQRVQSADPVQLISEAEQASLPVPNYPKRRGYKVPGGAGGSEQGVAPRGGRRHHGRSQPEVTAPPQDVEEEEEEDEDEEQEEKDANAEQEVEEQPPEGADSALIGRITNKKMREQLAAKFVITPRSGEGATASAAPKINNVRRIKKVPGASGAGDDEPKKTSYWGKQLGKAYMVTKKGIKKSAHAIADLPKYMEQAADSVNALLQLDGKGKLLALIEQVKGDIHFVRKEFSQFTLNWSPIMEKALDYMGETNLDKTKWNDRDELDLKKDALHSIVIGYEFMSIMVAWRENLLIAHEAYKLWLETLKSQYEQKHFDVDEDLLMQLSTIQNYLLLSAWEEIDDRTHENRMKLEHLMDLEDERPKNYESEYFRNIIVLQEMYYPTIEELDKEHDQVQESISTSGVVVDNLEQVTEFYDNFRKSIFSDQMTDVDCKVPKVLSQFLGKLKPQLEYTQLVYTKNFIKELAQASEERRLAAAEMAAEDEREEEPPVATKPKKAKSHFG